MSENANPNQDETGIKEKITSLLCEIVIPEHAQKLFLNNGSNPRIRDQAVAGCRQKIRDIIGGMDQINTQSLDIRMPGPDFIEMLLLSEYLYFNALNGEKAALKYLKKPEPELRMVRNFLRTFDYL